MLFRGRRIDNEEWSWGFYGECDSTQTHSMIVSRTGNCEEVDPATVGQFTGLHDKNGVEIYEGDIVHCWGGEHCQGYWEFNQTIAIKDLTVDCFMMGEFEFLKVIGNIHDNPELIESEDK